MPRALGGSIASFDGADGVPGLQVLPGCLHGLLPCTFGLGGDADGVQSEPHFRWATPFSAQAMVGRPADIVAKAELRDGVGDALHPADEPVSFLSHPILEGLEVHAHRGP